MSEDPNTRVIGQPIRKDVPFIPSVGIPQRPTPSSYPVRQPMVPAGR